jgi:drug/metabolite transporter (DMT)-like permease
MSYDLPPPPADIADRERSRGAGIAAVMMAVMAFSWGFIIIKTLPLPAPVIAAVRLAIGAVVLTAAAAALRVPWPLTRLSVLGAGVAFGAHQLVFILATQLTSVAIVTLVAATQPLMVAMVSYRALGERVSPWLWGCSVVAVAGVSIVVLASAGQVSRSWQGDLLAVLNAVLYTAYFLFAKRARMDGAPTLTFTASFLWVALAVVAPVVLVTGVTVPTAAQLGLLVVLALGPGNGHLLVNWAHRRVTAALSSIVLASIPILSSLWAKLVLGEPFTWQHVAGMTLVVIAIDRARRAELAAT